MRTKTTHWLAALFAAALLTEGAGRIYHVVSYQHVSA